MEMTLQYGAILFIVVAFSLTMLFYVIRSVFTYLFIEKNYVADWLMRPMPRSANREELDMIDAAHEARPRRRYDKSLLLAAAALEQAVTDKLPAKERSQSAIYAIHYFKEAKLIDENGSNELERLLTKLHPVQVSHSKPISALEK